VAEQTAAKSFKYEHNGVAQILIALEELAESKSGGTRTRTGDTMIFSLGRYVSNRFYQLQNPLKQAELLLCAFPDVSHGGFGLVSNRVSLPLLSEATAILSGGVLQALRKNTLLRRIFVQDVFLHKYSEDVGAGAKCSKGPPTPSYLLRIGVGDDLLPRRLFDKTQGGGKEVNKQLMTSQTPAAVRNGQQPPTTRK